MIPPKEAHDALLKVLPSVGPRIVADILLIVP